MAPLTYEQRVELLKKAREAKKNKKLAKSAPTEVAEPDEEEIVFEEQEEVEPPKKTRSKSVKPSKRPEPRTLNIKEPEAMPDFIDSEPEVEEQIIYKPKEKKKKKIIKRIIMEASSDEEEVEVIEERVKAPKKEKPAKKEIVPIPPTPAPVPAVNPFFNF